MKLKWKHLIASITDQCHLRCQGCYKVLDNSLTARNRHMSLKDFYRLLEIFDAQGGQTIDFVGGEPTDNPDFLDMVEASVGKKKEIWIYTNLINFALNHDLASRLTDLGGNITLVGKLNVPDLADAAGLRLQARLINSLLSVARLLGQGLENILRASFPFGKVGVENLLRKDNIEYAPAVYELGLKKGFFVDLEVPTCPVIASEKSFLAWLRLFPTKQQIEVCLEAIRLIDKKFGREICQNPMMPHLTGRNQDNIGQGCISFKSGALLIEYNGDLGLCSSGLPLVDGQRRLNIFFDSLEVIFNNPAMRRRQASCHQKNIQSGPCQTCKFWNHCLGGCAALRETLGDVLSSYPLCYLGEWKNEEELSAMFKKSKLSRR